ncbi:Uncharacterised protein [Mycobacteroides abscessus subsp. massiliense]|nr:Uncharacterised protein [Mycobacteroides abscessus subsp. massiliense]SKZ03656.1 Uncharacterised protein [Mycobacteroides abscessus subsp. massiliense]SLA43176.1 Uncharacterised protein [Mycobacteroides abscessus subsp. massiliense]
MRQIIIEQAARQRFRARGSGALAHPDGDHAGTQQQHIATFDRRRMRLVGTPDPEEARMMGVDEIRQRGLTYSRRQGQRGDRELASDPEGRVAGEQQIWQWFDDEIRSVMHGAHQRRLRHPAAQRKLVERHPTHEHIRQIGGIQRSQIRRKVLRQRVTQSARINRRRDALYPGRAAGKRLPQQIREQQHLDTTGTQHLRESVVLLLGASDPGQPVEQQLIVVSWSQPLEFVAGPVQHHCPQPPHLRIGTQYRDIRHEKTLACHAIERMCDIMWV